VAVVRTGDYEHDHPGPADVALVVEVSDTTFAADRRKVTEYAEVSVEEVLPSPR